MAWLCANFFQACQGNTDLMFNAAGDVYYQGSVSYQGLLQAMRGSDFIQKAANLCHLLPKMVAQSLSTFKTEIDRLLDLMGIKGKS